MKLTIAALILACPASLLAQKLDVKIVNRQDNETEYTYVVPSRVSSQSDSNVNCNDNTNYVNCNGSTTTNGYSMPARQVSYQVRGATFSLQLLDRRVAVVNCDSKFAERMAGPAGNHRSCRQPLVDNIQAEFHGDKAKLEWVVSLDGKKMQSETYKVLAILDKPESDHRGSHPAALRAIQSASGASAPPSPPPSLVARVTHLSLTSNPDQSEIQINGVFAGNTPLVMDLPSDPQIITISKRGFKPWTRVIKLTGGTMSILAELELDKAAASQ